MLEVTPSTLPFLAGWLAGAADKRFGGGPRWTMMVYMEMHKGRLTLEYLNRLERTLRRRWPAGERAPSIADAFRKGER